MTLTPFKPRLIAWGASGVVYKVSDRIAVKRRVVDCDEGFDFENEIRVYDLLESNPNVLVFDLHNRIKQHQTNNRSKSWQVLHVAYLHPRDLIVRWVRQLTDAVVTLESLRLMDGGIRPPNIFVDSNESVKLIDFGFTAPTGNDDPGIQSSYSRLLRQEAEPDHWIWGSYTPQAEKRFELGSIFYLLTRDYEPYENEWFGRDHGPITIELLQAVRFPALDGRNIDSIIRECWNGEYSSMKALKIDTLQLAQDEPLPIPRVVDTREYEATQKECEQRVKDGILESTEWQTPRQFMGYDRVSNTPCEDS
ncbi:hypothetical protein HO173_009582 [Letharia columbiana]|uniref:Protein kinase domain-containing protein n=1 Tax=Letharia columbiana TaxID=112416 RepID=A0A8H6FPA7_9LECA|nr:uncharacterized protein HO173_009582 [Letharia columbiana]KAF6232199.1 hypothetical protein HO173_009582 [Letharia columbiana]